MTKINKKEAGIGPFLKKTPVIFFKILTDSRSAISLISFVVSALSLWESNRGGGKYIQITFYPIQKEESNKS